MQSLKLYANNDKFIRPKTESTKLEKNKKNKRAINRATKTTKTTATIPNLQSYWHKIYFDILQSPIYKQAKRG